MLKNSFRGISRTKFARKLLNLRLPQALKFTQITALVPFSTATPDLVNRREQNIGRGVARDAIRETGYHQRRSALDRGSATIPELAIPHHIRFCWIVGAVRVACRSARKQVVAHRTSYHHRRGVTGALPWLPFVLTMSLTGLIATTEWHGSSGRAFVES